MMATNKTVTIKNCPEVRFKGFTDVWKQFRLGELCSEFRSGEFIKAEKITSSGDYPVYGGNGLRGYTDTYNHDGDFALIGRQGALCGNMQFSYGKAFFTEHAVAVKANNSNDTSFLYHLFGTMNLGQYSGQSAQPGLAVGNLIEIETLVPDKTEQAQIGNFFQNLDQSIALHEKKLIQIQNLKKAMLEKMFPKVGSKQPEIRLKGFSGDWEQTTLGEIADIYDGTHQTPRYTSSGIMFLSVENIVSLQSKKYISEEDFENDFSVFPVRNDILMTRIGDIGTANIVNSDEKLAYYVSLALLKPKKVNPEYLVKAISSEIVQKGIWRRTLHIAFPKKINKNEINNVEILVPMCDEEQSKIGQFFKKLDETLVLQQQQLQTLKNLKQAFLEKMFV
ncbi:restriction endonuclease subunit S [Acinetobacter populi]|uniref:Type I restriction modification DNA specificity domain-containing protein n=1 Tax=Acinetobacter populi TaxID=1582270 RepID=A0A1Z9Z242_9GAMM|nr:restriction endonuclease subunit S [Acinetobacter populi]OUY08530.1 hypothetical protein CAP51_02630 [Acinetobacter populi]